MIAEERLGITNVFDFARDSVYLHRAVPGRGGGHGTVSALAFGDIKPTDSDIASEFRIAAHMRENGFIRAVPGMVTDTVEQIVSTRTDLKTGAASTDTSYTTVSRLGMKYAR